jgi:hypothetical protein
MNRLLLALGVLVVSAFLIPDTADAQRGRGGGGGIGGGGFRAGGFGGGSRMYVPRGGAGGLRVGMGGDLRGGAITAPPGGPGRVLGINPGGGSFRPAGTNNPGGRFDNRFGNRRDLRYGVRLPGSYRGRYPYYGRYYGWYPYYGGYYPYDGGWGWGAGPVTGSVIGAAASTYPYYADPYATSQMPVLATVGGYCVTSVRTCALTRSAPVGVGCSCRIYGGQARGTVVATH